MIDVWCVFCGTKYHPGYVYALREAVAKNLKAEHRFRCLADRELPDIDVTLMRRGWTGWWSKLELFDVAEGPSLYFDLDVIITGELDYLVPYTWERFAAPANWAKSGHGGIQSSVMAWNAFWREPPKRFNPDVDMTRLWGDQEFLWELLGDDWVRIPGVWSFKYHCTSQLRGDEHVVVFHGKPDPHEAGMWTWSFTKTLRSIISDSRHHGFEQALRNAGIDCGSQTISEPRAISTSSAGRGTPSGSGSDTRASS